jgi:hypothetical protein
MSATTEFTPRDFFQLAREVADHEAELKMKLAKAGATDRVAPKVDRDKAPSV